MKVTETTFSKFFREASSEEKEVVFLEVARKASEAQRIDHIHCFKAQEGHDKHVRCCLCLEENATLTK